MSSDDPSAPADTVALEMLGTKWKPPIIVHLRQTGADGFGGLKTALEGVSNKVLSENLSTLVEREVLNKELIQESPRRVEYTLTPAGEELYELIQATADWDREYVDSRGLPEVLVVDDDPRQLELMRAWLNSSYNVTTVSSGDRARQALDEDVDVAIFDRYLDDSSAESLIEAGESAGVSPPVGLLSSTDISVQMVELPADMLLSKPTSEAELTDAVNRLYRMNELSPLARRVQAYDQRLSFVRDAQGPAVEATEPYRRATETHESLRQRWKENLNDQAAWRSLEAADSIDELVSEEGVQVSE